MRIAALKETVPGETRVAVSPATVSKFSALGIDIAVETGAGEAAGFSDGDFAGAGAQIAADAAQALAGAAVVLKVAAPSPQETALFDPGTTLAAILSPRDNPESAGVYAKAGINALALDLMPRITRAQSMDVLSSQSNLAGYRSVIDAAAAYGRALPMMMTAAGTIAAAKVFVMGAGVAGLQAVATARRLGAVVSATDVRLAAKEQVESLGAVFMTVDEQAMKEAETEGGYAREMSGAFRARQAAFIAEHVAKQDIVITTALIPGRTAPRLLDEDAVRSMRAGSVVVDLAAGQGGNVEPARPDEVVRCGGVTVVGYTNFPGRMPGDASALYARNVFSFVSSFYDREQGAFVPDRDDEIIRSITLSRDGAVVHPDFVSARNGTDSVREPAPEESASGQEGAAD